jgi:hypothetical protein
VPVIPASSTEGRFGVYQIETGVYVALRSLGGGLLRLLDLLGVSSCRIFLIRAAISRPILLFASMAQRRHESRMLPLPAGGVPKGVPNGDLRPCPTSPGRYMYKYYLSDDLELSKTCSMVWPT